MSPHSLLRHYAILALLPLTVALSGCARYPDTGTGSTGQHIIFSLSTDGPVKFGTEPGSLGNPYIYIFAINLSTSTSPTTFGPKPVVVAPYGNGLMTGDATHFILWDPTFSNQFLIYQFDDATLQTSHSIGIPVIPHIASVGDKRLICEIDLSQLVPDATSRALIKSMQVNVLTMDKRGGTGGSRNWDALGDGRNVGEINTAFTIPLDRNGTYNNTLASIKEPNGDVADPTLDLTDWQVEVQLR